MQPLKGRVAVVAGATRGAGRGIARMLGEAGATVYCTGRSSRTQPNTSDHHYAGRPESIEETAEMVTAAGGTGIPVRVDHTVETEVEALFARVWKDQGRLDALVNVITGRSVASYDPFWKLSVSEGRAMVDSWIWPHIATCRHGVPLMVEGKSGLIVEIVEQDRIGCHGQFYFDLYETVLKRMALSLAEELAPHNVAAVAITPGFMRTEAILERFGVGEENWRDAAEQNEEAKRYGFAGSETPCFVGRAVAALASDPNRMTRSGGLYSSWELSEEYGFEDIDGRRPHLTNYWKGAFPHLLSEETACGRTWRVAESFRAGQRPS